MKVELAAENEIGKQIYESAAQNKKKQRQRKLLC